MQKKVLSINDLLAAKRLKTQQQQQQKEAQEKQISEAPKPRIRRLVEALDESEANTPKFDVTNVKHFRFREHNENGSAISNRFAITVSYTNPQIDIIEGTTYVDVGVAICFGDNFDRRVGAAIANERALNRCSPELRTRIYLREVDPESQYANYTLLNWRELLLDPDGRRRINVAIREILWKYVEKRFLSESMRDMIDQGFLELIGDNPSEAKAARNDSESEQSPRQPKVRVHRINSLEDFAKFMTSVIGREIK